MPGLSLQGGLYLEVVFNTGLTVIGQSIHYTIYKYIFLTLLQKGVTLYADIDSKF